MNRLLKTGIATVMALIPLAGMAESSDGVVYRDKNVRITVVTDGLVRMEYSPKGRFTDDRSLVAINRSYPENSARVTDNGKNVTVTTPRMILTYKKGKGPFTAENLKVTSAPGMKNVEWTPGMEQKENLKGTTRTLDRWDGQEYLRKEGDEWKSTRQELEPGLLARDGWTLIDDSKSYLLDSDEVQPWVKTRAKDKGAQDWYLMVYGDDYKGALKDFTVLSGRIPLPPRYAFGYWWSRWWAYSDHEFRKLVDNFDSYGIPLEILVVDMDWHYTDEAHGGWTGWTWNRRLFPDPKGFINYLRDRNLKITLNLHPASGVKKFEESYPEIAQENGVDPKTEADIPWVSSDKRFINSMFRHILDPMTAEGVNFWWLDWQQDLNDSKLKDLSNTWWINHAFFNHMKNSGTARPMIFHRWGGLGNHRYQIGFSGDSYATWKTLAFMPYFTSTAANVGYGYWCHDIGGFYMAPGDTVFNPELYTRSFQFAAYSPMMRTHSTKNAKLQKEPWSFDNKTLSNIRSAVQRRYEMAPYIYTMARKAYDTGVSICRPMYYDYPGKEEAYNFTSQYMYGDNMIVAPVITPAVDGYSTVEVWLPEGDWYENATGTMLKGGKVYSRRYALDEFPVYVKAGSVLPYHAGAEKTLRRNDAPWSFCVYPGESGEFTVYEDFGDDSEYDTEYAMTTVTSRRSGNNLTVTVSPRSGKYREMPESRGMEVKVLATKRPVSVKVDGVETSFTYEPEQLAAVIKLPVKNASVQRKVEVTFPDNSCIADGTIGNMHRFVTAFGDLKNRYATLEVTEDFGPLSVIYEAIGYYPEKTDELVGQFRERFSRLNGIVKEQPMNDSARDWFIKSVGLENRK